MNRCNGSYLPSDSFQAYAIYRDKNGNEKRKLLSKTLTDLLVKKVFSNQGANLVGERVRISKKGIRYFANGNWSEIDHSRRQLGCELINRIDGCLSSIELSVNQRMHFSALNKAFQQYQKILDTIPLPEDLSAFKVFFEFWRGQAILLSQVKNLWEKKQWIENLHAFLSKQNVLRQFYTHFSCDSRLEPMQEFFHHCSEMMSFAGREEKHPKEQACIKCISLIRQEKEYIADLLFKIEEEESHENYVFSFCKPMLEQRLRELHRMYNNLKQGALEDAIGLYRDLGKNVNEVAALMEDRLGWATNMNKRLKNDIPEVFHSSQNFLAFFQNQAKKLHSVVEPLMIKDIAILNHLYPEQHSLKVSNVYVTFEEALQQLHKFRNFTGLIASFLKQPNQKEVFIKNLKEASLNEAEIHYFFELFPFIFEKTEHFIEQLSKAQEEWMLQEKEYQILKNDLKIIEEEIQSACTTQFPALSNCLHERLSQIKEFLNNQKVAKTFLDRINKIEERYCRLYAKTQLLHHQLKEFFESTDYADFINSFIKVVEINEVFNTFKEVNLINSENIKKAILKTYNEFRDATDFSKLPFFATPFCNPSCIFTSVTQHFNNLHKNLLENNLRAKFAAAIKLNKMPNEVSQKEQEEVRFNNSVITNVFHTAKTISQEGSLLRETLVQSAGLPITRKMLSVATTSSNQSSHQEEGFLQVSLLKLLSAIQTPLFKNTSSEKSVSVPNQNNEFTVSTSVNEQQLQKVKDNIKLFNDHLVLFYKLKIWEGYKLKVKHNALEMSKIDAQLLELHEEFRKKSMEIDQFIYQQMGIPNSPMKNMAGVLQAYLTRVDQEVGNGQKTG